MTTFVASEHRPSIPADGHIERIVFVPPGASHGKPALSLPTSLGIRAILISEEESVPPEYRSECHLLFVPSTRILRNGSSTPIEAELQNWISETKGNHGNCVMTFQGVQIYWSPSRCAVVAPPEQFESIRNAIVEVTFCEWELTQIEASLAASWPDLENDIPLAFEFGEKSLPGKDQLGAHFRTLLLTKARLARVGPSVLAPHHYPPTLASQLSERLRERTRVAYRHEFLTEQLEVFNAVYEQAGQRASDYRNARTGHILEWLIIIILLAQTVMWFMETLANSSDSEVQPSAPSENDAALRQLAPVTVGFESAKTSSCNWSTDWSARY